MGSSLNTLIYIFLSINLFDKQKGWNEENQQILNREEKEWWSKKKKKKSHDMIITLYGKSFKVLESQSDKIAKLLPTVKDSCIINTEDANKWWLGIESNSLREK